MDVQSLSAIKKAKAALEAKMDTISDSVAVELDKGNDRLDNSLAKFEDTVDSMPSGVPAPSLAAFSAVSTADGISVTMTANDSTVESNNAKNVLAVTKGVMVRYSDVRYPKNKEDGALAFVDEDLFDVNTSGTRVAKAKTHTVTGLTMNSTYYFSAFPYSTGLAYNEQLGTSNVIKRKWTGLTGTLTVNVTSNDSTIPLEEYTVSLKPTAGDAITKQQTGTGRVVFSDIDRGVYTLSFTYSGVFNKPADQQVTVVVGEATTVTAKFEVSSSFESASWEEISRISTAGLAEKKYSVGDTKDITVNGETVTLQIYGFNHDPLADGSGMAGITLGMKHLLKTTRMMDSSSAEVTKFSESSMYTWLNGAFYNSLPADLRAIIKSVKKKGYQLGTDSKPIIENMTVFLFSSYEVDFSNAGGGAGEGVQYPIFTNNKSRIKKLSSASGIAEHWWLRSQAKLSPLAFKSVSNNGSLMNAGNNAYNVSGVCAGFCI